MGHPKEPMAFPLSRLYHQESKLSNHKLQQFVEQIVEFGGNAVSTQHATVSFKQYPTREQIDLPRSSRRLGGHRLRDVLRQRRTRRGEFTSRQVNLKQWGTLFEMSCGLTGKIAHPEYPDIIQDLRAWPSAGALYPIELYIASLVTDEIERAWYHYQVQTHRLAKIGPCPSEEQLAQLVYADGLWSNASGLLVLTGNFNRTQQKYGERGYRFLFLDAGHLAQNLLLACEDLGLAAIPLGAFDDDMLAKSLELDTTREAPLYAILVGTRTS
jgi:SagB-type dehydrogenase family enzyme